MLNAEPSTSLPYSTKAPSRSVRERQYSALISTECAEQHETCVLHLDWIPTLQELLTQHFACREPCTSMRRSGRVPAQPKRFLANSSAAFSNSATVYRLKAKQL